MLNITAKSLFFVCLLFSSARAMAGLMSSLFDVQLPVADESAETRSQAFERGMDEIFIRLSGDSVIMDKLQRPPASRYIMQFSYEPLAATEETDIDDAMHETPALRHVPDVIKRLLDPR